MGIIIINALCIGLETVDKFKTTEANTFKILDEFFLSIYTMEFLMKIYAEPSTYWKSSYNIFDFTILLTSYIQVIMDELNVGDNLLTPLRLLRGKVGRFIVDCTLSAHFPHIQPIIFRFQNNRIHPIK